MALGVNPSVCFSIIKTSSPLSLAPRVRDFQRTSPPARTESSKRLPPSSLPSTALYAAKKKVNAAKNAALAALEALEAQESNVAGANTGAAKASATAIFDDDDDEPLSKKDQIALEKKRQKEMKKQQKDQERIVAAEQDEIEKNKRKRALKALAEMEAAEKSAGTVNGHDGKSYDSGENDSSAPTMSKKEMKMAEKKAEKEAEKLAQKELKKKAKKLGVTVEELEQMEGGGDNDDEFDIGSAAVNGGGINRGDDSAVNGENVVQEKTETLTAEERIRKERPPPRIRIMESSQPDYTALRLENIAITFRDQPVLKSATWGVQTGDRIGLVGANGAGKTTQLRILAGELEPTAGDVVKSHKDLRVAMLRQEFIDEIVLTRTLREEFMSVFTEEAEIMTLLREAEEDLAQMRHAAHA